MFPFAGTDPFSTLFRLKSKGGVITHAPEQARTCLQRNAFGTPDWACFQRRPLVEIVRFVVDCSRKSVIDCELHGFIGTNPIQLLAPAGCNKNFPLLLPIAFASMHGSAPNKSTQHHAAELYPAKTGSSAEIRAPTRPPASGASATGWDSISMLPSVYQALWALS